jgi:hypothetical protein
MATKLGVMRNDASLQEPCVLKERCSRRLRQRRRGRLDFYEKPPRDDLTGFTRAG